MHLPNPLDRLFLAIDEAWERCGLPGVDIWTHIECDGRVDFAGMQAALRALGRIYPATTARYEPGDWLRAPRWRIAQEPNADAPIEVSTFSTPDETERWIEATFATRIDWTSSSPLRLYLLREPAGDDRVLLRWPHAFADARGGATLIEELARLYDERPELETLKSAGDELRRDAGALDRAVEGLAHQRARRPRRTEIRWNDTPPETGRERVGLEFRRLDPGQSSAVREAALRICGVARLADYLRAAGICALHDVRARPAGDESVYSTVHLIDGRRKRDPGPVCHNLFSAIPVYVPAAIAGNRRAVADAIEHAAAEAIATGRMQRAWRRMKWSSRVPMPVLSRIIAQSLRGGRRWLPLGLANAPSMPLGFMGPLTTPRTTFCGARLRNIFGVRPPSLQAGFAINVNFAQDRINIAASFFEPRFPRAAIAALLDRYETLLQDGRADK